MKSLEQLHLEIASAVSAIFAKHAQQTRPQDEGELRMLFLREWRHSRAKVEGVRHYRIFSNRTLRALAERDPRTPEALLEVPGIGPKRLELMGASLLDALAQFRDRGATAVIK